MRLGAPAANRHRPPQPPLCHCLTPLYHPNILNPPPADGGDGAAPLPREQNVCCSYLHGSSFADAAEVSFELAKSDSINQELFGGYVTWSSGPAD
jgi:hypothetical protein